MLAVVASSPHQSPKCDVLRLAQSIAIPLSVWWWWCRPHPVHEHAQDLRPPLGARPASPPTRQASQPPPRGPSTNPKPLV